MPARKTPAAPRAAGPTKAQIRKQEKAAAEERGAALRQEIAGRPAESFGAYLPKDQERLKAAVLRAAPRRPEPGVSADSWILTFGSTPKGKKLAREMERRQRQAQKREEAQRKRAEKAGAAARARLARIEGRQAKPPSNVWAWRFWAALNAALEARGLQVDNARRASIWSAAVADFTKFGRPPEETAHHAAQRECLVPTDRATGSEFTALPAPEPRQPPRGTLGKERGQRYAFVPRSDLPDLPPLPPPGQGPAPAQPRACGDGPACKLATRGGECAIRAPLFLPEEGGRSGLQEVPARYCVIEADRLVTSHDPLKGYQPSPDYPAGVQERRYERDQNEVRKVEGIANQFRPELIFNTSPSALDGPPIVDERGRALGGNGRAMALKLVYAGRSDSGSRTPRQYLLENAQAFGLTPAQIEKYRRPVLVRTIAAGDEPRELARWSRILNQKLGNELDPRAQAVSQSRLLSEEAIRDLLPLGPDASLADFLGSAQARPFVARLRADGIINDQNASVWLRRDGGGLTEDGKTQVIRLLAAAVLPTPDAADLLDLYGPGPSGALAKAAPFLLAAAAANPAYDLRPILPLVVRDLTRARSAFPNRSGMGGTYVPIEYLRQTSLFGEGPQLHMLRGTRALMAHDLFWGLGWLDGSPAKLARAAARYAELARANAPGQGGLFPGAVTPPDLALREALEQSGARLIKRQEYAQILGYEPERGPAGSSPAMPPPPPPPPGKS